MSAAFFKRGIVACPIAIQSVGLQSRLRPDAMNGGRTQSGRLCHLPAGPVRTPISRLLLCLLQYPRQNRRSRPAGTAALMAAFESPDPALIEARLPARNRRSGQPLIHAQAFATIKWLHYLTEHFTSMPDLPVAMSEV